VSTRDDEEFIEYVMARLRSLRRTAYLLCADWQQVDDLVQTAIARLYVHWGRARHVEHRDAYTRTILVRAYLSERRSGWSRRVVLSAQPREVVGVPEDTEGRLDMQAALAGLAPRQRATLVLRFYCDLNVDQTADLLGCSPGTVKSQTAKGLDSLRRALEPAGAVPSPAPRPGAPGRAGYRLEQIDG